MAVAASHQSAQVLEAGNVAFFYRPKLGVLHPQTSDDIGQTEAVLFPDDQGHHQNRLVVFPTGVFPLIMSGQNLPEERGWAFVEAVSHDPRGVIDALLQDNPSPTPSTSSIVQPITRIAAAGRYAIVHEDSAVYLSYALSEPRQLGWAQKTLLLDTEGAYLLRVVEPAMPTPYAVSGSPSYPDALGEQFDGHGSIPAEPTNFLDYQWTRLFFVGTETDVKAVLGINLPGDVENQAEQVALAQLRTMTPRIQSATAIDVWGPLRTGRLE